MRVTKPFLLLALIVVVGCQPGESSNPAADFAGPPPPPPPPPPDTSTYEGYDSDQNTARTVSPTGAPDADSGTQASGKREVAKTGVSEKASSIEGGGLVTTPIRVLFRAEDRIIFEIRIPDAMSKFKALNGRAPKSHEEFKKEILDAYNIALPKLPDGDTYIYDPETGQLMVQHPPK